MEQLFQTGNRSNVDCVTVAASLVDEVPVVVVVVIVVVAIVVAIILELDFWKSS